MPHTVLTQAVVVSVTHSLNFIMSTDLHAVHSKLAAY